MTEQYVSIAVYEAMRRKLERETGFFYGASCRPIVVDGVKYIPKTGCCGNPPPDKDGGDAYLNPRFQFGAGLETGRPPGCCDRATERLIS